MNKLKTWNKNYKKLNKKKIYLNKEIMKKKILMTRFEMKYIIILNYSWKKFYKKKKTYKLNLDKCKTKLLI
jgi:hypothetical protein